jgi:hypothetical protein
MCGFVLGEAVTAAMPSGGGFLLGEKQGACHAGGFLTIILAVVRMKLKAVRATFKHSGPPSSAVTG